MKRLLGRRALPPRIKHLGSLSLFSLLTANELRIVDELLHEREFRAGEIIFDEGETGQAIYFVLAGSVRICRAGLGDEGLIAELDTGAFFGDMALLDSAPRAAQARAASDCTLAVLFREDFLALTETHARIATKIALQLARAMGERLRQRAGERSAVRQQL